MRNYPATTGKYRLTGAFDPKLTGMSKIVQELARAYRRKSDAAWVKAADAAGIDTLKRTRLRHDG